MKKLIAFLFIFLISIFICINSYAKYVIENTSLVANINIDGEIPKIEFLNVSNTNEKYNKYANKTHTITVEFRIKEKNIKKDNIQAGIKFFLDDTQFNPSGKEISRREEGEYIYYKYTLSKLRSNGRLKIKIPKGVVIDIADQVNEEVIFDTGITIDNIAPVVSFSQEEIEDGKILAKIKANEKIRDVNAWNLCEEDTALSKEFSCNVLYPFDVTDLAENSTNIDVKIDKATNIKIKYGSMSEGPYNNWEFGTGISEITGEKAIEFGSEYKIEGISLYWEGLDKDFIQTKCFINTYWGEGVQGICNTYETNYNYGYNGYLTLKTGPIIVLDGKATLLIGGKGMNKEGNMGFGGKPIPKEIADKHLFGISSLSIKLKDTSYYSIVYQAWVDGEGWLEPASDGEETTFLHNKPIGAYRMSLIPTTEKQYLIDLWEKDVGTNNMK